MGGGRRNGTYGGWECLRQAYNLRRQFQNDQGQHFPDKIVRKLHGDLIVDLAVLSGDVVQFGKCMQQLLGKKPALPGIWPYTMAHLYECAKKLKAWDDAETIVTTTVGEAISQVAGAQDGADKFLAGSIRLGYSRPRTIN